MRIAPVFVCLLVAGCKPSGLQEVELGGCELSASGAATVEEKTPVSGNSRYWMSERDLVEPKQPGFVLSCIGKQMKLSIVTSEKTAVEFKPKVYEVDEAKGSDVQLLGSAPVDRSLHEFSGTVEVTAFDAEHIAGSVDVTATQISGGGSVKLKGTFDLRCVGWGKCGKS